MIFWAKFSSNIQVLIETSDTESKLEVFIDGGKNTHKWKNDFSPLSEKYSPFIADYWVQTEPGRTIHLHLHSTEDKLALMFLSLLNYA